MKVRLLITPFLASKDFWVLPMAYHAFFQSLRKYTDFKAVVYFPPKCVVKYSGDIPYQGDTVSKNIFHDHEVTETPLELDADIIICPATNMGSDQRQAFRDFLPLNKGKRILFLWLDCQSRLESDMEEFFGLLPSTDFMNCTHWDKQTLPNQVVLDYCHNPDLELPIHGDKIYDFGFNGYFFLKKNMKWVDTAIQYSYGKPVSIIGGVVDEDAKDKHRGGFDSLQEYKDKIICHGCIESWDIGWPIMSQSWFHLNSHKPRHATHGSIVRKFTMCAEAGTICLQDPDDTSSINNYPRLWLNYPTTLAKWTKLSAEDKIWVMHQQREFSRKEFNSDERTQKILAMMLSVIPDYHDFRTRFA